MLRSLWARWQQRPRRAAASAAAPPSAAPAHAPCAAPAMAAAAPLAGAAPAAAPLALPWPTAAGQPLVSLQGRLAGFEFPLAATLRARWPGGGEGTAFATLLAAMRLCAAQGPLALGAVPAAWAPRLRPADVRAGMWLALLPAPAASEGDDPPTIADPQALEAAVQRLREAGARIGWAPAAGAEGDAGATPFPAPDFLLLRAAAGSTGWLDAAQAARARWPGVPLVLLDLPDIAALEHAQALKVALAGCRLALPAPAAAVKPLAPQAQRLLQLLQRVVRDDDNAALAALIKSDAALSLRLLQFLNSAGATPGRELDSIDQAVLVLGRAGLYGWISQMLVRLAPPRPASAALQAMALARARLLEALARAANEPQPGALYLLGLVSMLPTLLQCGLDDALATLPLPAPAQQALRGRDGPWARYLALAEALEQADVVRAEPLAAGFGGLPAVLALSAGSWLER